ncbi:MAG: hypothetical protein JW910_11070 [Anaerolineae bacterium]|nr:hypothetical protein [Anaerolineae bacterium]
MSDSTEGSIFADDWRDCLEAHYQHVIRIQDKITEPSLREVLLRVGFSEQQINEMAIWARMRDTDAHPDDLPDLGTG